MSANNFFAARADDAERLRRIGLPSMVHPTTMTATHGDARSGR
jgi:hypothetical protein